MPPKDKNPKPRLRDRNLKREQSASMREQSRVARVPSRMRELLKSFVYRNASVAFSQFPVSFLQQTSEKWDYKEWGYDTLLNCLMSLDDIITMEETETQPRICMRPEARQEYKEAQNRIPESEKCQEMDFSCYEWTPLEDDRSHYSEWNLGNNQKFEIE